MNSAAAQQPGYTTVLTSIAMNTPLTIRATDNGGPVRSVTVGNQTSATSVSVYIGNSPAGSLLYSVLPGNYATIPIMASSAITLAFSYATGGKFDGTIFVHTDPQPLAASGFTQSQQNIVGLTPVVLWIGSEANGTVTGYCPPVFNAAGVATANTEHIVRGTATVGVSATNSFVQQTITFQAAAIFTSTPQLFLSYFWNGNACPAGWNYAEVLVWAVARSAAGFTVQANTASMQSATGAGSITYDYLAIGS